MAIAAYWGHGFSSFVVDNLNYMDPSESDFQAALIELEAALLSELTPQFKARSKEARDAGLDFLCYEGGQHITTTWRDFNGNGDWDDTVDQQHRAAQTSFLTDLNRRDEMADLHTLLFDLWEQYDGAEFLAFNDVGPYADFGSCGYREFWYQTAAEAPKARAFENWLERMQHNHILNFQLAGGSLGHVFDGRIDLEIRSTPYNLSVTGGSLPHGLSLHSDGSFSGVVQDYGTFEFELSLTDPSGFVDARTYAMEIAPDSRPIRILPAADTHAVGWSSGTNFGDKTYLMSGEPGREAYVKWDIGVLAGKTIRSAEVILEHYSPPYNGASTQGRLYSNDANWEEMTLTWSTRPALGSLVSEFPITTNQSFQRTEVTQWLKDSQANPEVGLTIYADLNLSRLPKESPGKEGIVLEVQADPDMIVPITYDYWVQTHFPDSPDPAVDPETAPAADPDGDAIVNELEYVLGLDPMEVEDAPPYSLETIEGRLIFRFPLHSSHHDKTVRVEGCHSLDSWSDELFSSAAHSIDLSYGWNMVEVDVTDHVSANDGRYFVRMQVEDR